MYVYVSTCMLCIICLFVPALGRENLPTWMAHLVAMLLMYQHQRHLDAHRNRPSLHDRCGQRELEGQAAPERVDRLAGKCTPQRNISQRRIF